jgi:hypothetical protein
MNMVRLCRSMTVMLVVLALIIALAGLGPLLLVAAAANNEVGIRVWPSTAIEPATLRIQVVVERNAQNRALRIVADSSEFFTSSEVPLEGDRSQRVRVVTFRSVPAGRYELRGELIGENGDVRGIARTSALVIGLY